MTTATKIYEIKFPVDTGFKYIDSAKGACLHMIEGVKLGSYDWNGYRVSTMTITEAALPEVVAALRFSYTTHAGQVKAAFGRLITRVACEVVATDKPYYTSADVTSYIESIKNA